MAAFDDATLERSVTMHVNVSPRQLSDAGFVERTTNTLSAAGVDLRQLVLEFTEATALAGNPAITRSLNALARLDVRLSIDDFGTGYSSLAHLRNFRAAQLKLDGTFIRNVGRDGADDPSGRAIGQLYAINTLGAVLGTLVAGFFLIGEIGIRGSIGVAALPLGGIVEIEAWAFKPAK